MKRPTLAVFLSLGLALAQEPVFRTGTQLVEVQVVVQDKAGKPVFDLDKRQFRVLEDGKPRDIAFFLAPAKQPPSTAKPLPAGVFTNRPEFLPGASQTITAIVLDFLNTSEADQLFAKAEVAKYLRQIGESEPFALYLFTNRVAVVHDFGEPRASLASKLESLRAISPGVGVTAEEQLRSEAAAFTELVNRALPEPLGDVGKELVNLQRDIRVRTTLQLVEQLAQHIAGIPGRKNLVWISSGVPMFNDASMISVGASPSLRGFNPEFSTAIRTLNAMNIAVYAVDARGLRVQGEFPIQAARTGRRGNSTAMVGSMRDESISSARRIAEETGGRFIWNTNDLALGIRSAVEDARASYTVAWYADPARDGNASPKPRSIEIRVERKDVAVRHRKETPALEQPSRLLAQDFLGTGLSPSRILLNAVVRKSADGLSLATTVQIEPGNLRFLLKDGSTKGEVEIYYLQTLKDGKTALNSSKLMLSLDPKQLAKLESDGLVVNKDIALQPTAARLRILVRDALSGAAGSIDASLSGLPSAE